MKRILVVALCVTLLALDRVSGASAVDHNLRVLAGLATTDAKAVWWTYEDYTTYNSLPCRPDPPGGWWHCDDGVGKPALDLVKPDLTVTDPQAIGPCPPDQTVDGICGSKVFFQAYNLSPGAPLVARVFSHGTSCSGVSVRLYEPDDTVNAIASFEFVHMSEGAVGQTFFVVGTSFTIFELGRVQHPDCTSEGPHLHQSGGLEGTALTKNSGLTAGCAVGTYCQFGPTGDYTNNWMHNVSWNVPDEDGDGVLDGSDNCIFVANPSQSNNDRNFIPNQPYHPVGDVTRERSDNAGDACDLDDDNDLLTDSAEAAGCNGSGPLNQNNLDTDGDYFIDGIECSLGTNPANPASKPGTIPINTAACGPTGDSDGDLHSNRLETCALNTDPNNFDTDGDRFSGGGRDACESAAVGVDNVVNSQDQLLLALEWNRSLASPPPLPNFDMNKSGTISSVEQLLQAIFIANPSGCF